MSNKGLGERKERKSNSENYISVKDLENNNLSEIYKLANKIGIESLEIDEGIKLLGYKNALIYTNFFVKHSIQKEYFLKGVTAIVNEVISINELHKLAEKSDLEISVGDIVAKFNFSERQLRQKEYWRKNSLTHKSESGDNVHKGHDYEHRLSRRDRESD